MVLAIKSYILCFENIINIIACYKIAETKFVIKDIKNCWGIFLYILFFETLF